MRREALFLLVLGASVVLRPGVAMAQQTPEAAAEAPRVYFDCQTFYCDYDHVRREIPYVNWVRDRQDADIHVLITMLRTGGGGRQFTFDFIGLGSFAGRTDTLQYVSDATDTQDEIRTGITRTIKLGLVGFLAGTPLAARLDVTYRAPEVTMGPQGTVTPEEDPWNFWVFTIGFNGFGNGEQQQRFFSGNARISANRTTEQSKLDFQLSAFGNRQEFDVVDTTIGLDTTFVSTRTSYGFDALAVWSLGPHWSWGVRAGADRSSRLNQDLALRVGPALEFNIYPYAESTRRQLTVEYSVGVAAFNYEEITVYDRTSEVRPIHRLRVGIGVTQPWGSVNLSVFGSQYLHDLTKHSATLSGGVNLRIFRGLNFNVFGSVSRIKDQLYIAKAGLTPEEVLLEIRSRETDFRYFVSLGLSYRFGSKFANVVNTRMGGGGGGGVTIIMN